MPTLVNRAREVLLGPTSIVFASNMARSGLALVINILVARWLGPDQFGLYYIFVITMIIVHNATGEGLDSGVVRYYAYYASHEPREVATVTGSALCLRLCVGVPLVVAGVSGAGWLSVHALGNFAFAEPLRLGALAALGSSLAGFGLAIFQARHQFIWRAVMTPFANLLRILSLPLLLWLDWFVLSAVLWSHTALLFVSALVILWLLRAELGSARMDWQRVGELFNFSKWSVLALVGYLVYSNLAVPVLGHVYGPQAAGIFAAAASLTLAVEYAVAAIMVVQLPRVSEHRELAQFRHSVRRLLTRCAGAVLVLVPIALLARPLILTIYGPEYEESIVVFQILFVGILTNLLTHPASVVFLAMNRVRMFALSHTLPVAMWIAVGVLLVPSHGITGAAIATVAARVLAALVILWFLWRLLAVRTRDDGGVNA